MKYKMAPSIGSNTIIIIQTSLLFFLKLLFSISTKAETHNRTKKAIISIDLILNIGGIIISFSGFEISFNVNPVYNIIGLNSSISTTWGIYDEIKQLNIRNTMRKVAGFRVSHLLFIRQQRQYIRKP